MIPVKGGRFMMSPPLPGLPTTDVTVKDFYISRTEITWEQIEVWMFRLDMTEREKLADSGIYDSSQRSRPSKPYSPPDFGYGFGDHPVIGVTHHSAKMFCQWLSRKTGRNYRMPTEAEWEYAARGPAAPVPAKPLDTDMLDRIAWHRGNADEHTHSVGQKQANILGLYDILGNAGEWCTDLRGQPVLCGGSWKTWPGRLDWALRQRETPSWRARDVMDPQSPWFLLDADFVGFRIVCDPDPSVTAR
jgi:formylglycine-generating enzyme required for sulfatase activity